MQWHIVGLGLRVVLPPVLAAATALVVHLGLVSAECAAELQRLVEAVVGTALR